ncbi:MAG TPA: TonB-dependent receptor [Vicinamibacterales bacterium]
MNRLTRNVLVLATLLAPAPALAQQTTGSIIGRVADEQGGAVPGAMVVATSGDTGFVRETITDAEGLYRLAALPVGQYDLVIELQGFTRVERNDVIVNVSRVTDLDAALRVAQVAETVVVTGDTPLIPTSSSGLGDVVDIARIESLPLNGRQFANLAATVPGVGLGFNSEVTKSSQYTPQISGGNGRNINYLVDGGDNNDDTTGGLLQLFPLEAIQEFNLMTHRFNAEYGRSNGAVLNVVTRSGTNDLRGSWFSLFRDDALNARTFSEKLSGVNKQAYRRYQYGGSVGGPIIRSRLHYFGAFERTQQDTRQPVNTGGVLPEADGVYPVPVRETMFTGKLTATLTPAQYLAIRYGRNANAQPSNAGPRNAPESWSRSRNTYDSANANHNWIVGESGLNELIVQYSDFHNGIPASGAGPSLLFPNGVRAGANPVAPQATEQRKWHLRDDVTVTRRGLGGLGHTLKFGVNWIHEPRLFTSTESLFEGQYTFTANNVTAPLREIVVIGGAAAANIPLDQYGLYAQDDWRLTDRLTLNLGVRWDYVDGVPLNQDGNPNFLAMQAAGRAGRFAGTALEDFGREPRGDKDNIQPRAGFSYDVRGDGRDVVRGGWGLYTDFAYTNANMLTAAFDAAGGSGIVFLASNPAGLRRPDGTWFRVDDSLSMIASQNLVNPNLPLLAGHVVSPRLEQPYTRQANIGWAHELGDRMAMTVDYVRVDGRNINTRLRPNALVNGRPALADLPIQPNAFQFRTAISKGRSQYDGLILGLSRRMSRGVEVNAWYTLSESTSDVGPAYDELDANLVQDVRDPFGPVQNGPTTRTDARHRATISAIVNAPWGVQVAPFFMYRSALPTHTFEGMDLNADGNVVDKTALAYRYTGLDEATGRATFEDAGVCETVSCSRRAPFSQLNLRVSRGFSLGGSVNLEAIAEVFNLFNAKNPFIPITTQRVSSAGVPLASFMQPTAYAGDFQQPEQRVGQIGFRLTF